MTEIEHMMLVICVSAVIGWFLGNIIFLITSYISERKMKKRLNALEEVRKSVLKK